MNYKRLYVKNSIIFITVVTSKRRELIIDNIDVLRNSFKSTMQQYKFEIIAINILKNHIHMLIKPENVSDYPNIIKTIKSSFSKNIDTNLIEDYEETSSRKNKGEKDIWQRRYWEHTIISEEDLFKHIDYIHYNSAKHYGIPPKLWKYSSFKRFVNAKLYDEDWCNFEDKYNINNLDYE